MPSIRTISVSGSIPSITQLALGDLAVNTFDGKAYLKKQQGTRQTILEIGGGSSVSSSYALSSSFAVSASYALSSSYAANGGVTQIIAGTNITLSPAGGTGIVTVNAIVGGGGSGVPNGPLYSLQYNNGGLFSGSSNFTLLNNNALYLTGSLNVSGSIIGLFTGSLLGTSSWSSNSISSSFAVSSSRAVSSSFAISSSYALSSSFALTASLAPLYVLTSITSSMLAPYLLITNTSSMLSPYLLTSRTSSFATTGSNTFIGSQIISGSTNITGSLIITGSTISTLGFTGSLQGTSSWSNNAITASYIITAQTASYVLQAVSASNASSASAVFIASNNGTNNNYALVFKNNSLALDNYHQLAADGINGPFYNPGTNILGGVGGITISGSIGSFTSITGSSFTGSFTGSLLGTSSFATTASYALAAQSFPYTGSAQITGSLVVTGSISQADDLGSLNINQEVVYLPFGIPAGLSTIVSKTFAGPTSMFLDYQIISGSNQRTGTITANFNFLGTPTSTYYETVAADIGNTSMISFLTSGTSPYLILANNSGPTPFTLKAILRYF